MFLSLLLTNNICCGELFIPDVFGDNMVLQETMEVPIWGKANPKAKVTVRAQWQDDVNNIVDADDNGKWKLFLSTPQASFEPYTIEIKSAESVIQYNNVLIGQVWLCSGQSNMAFVLNRSQDGSSEAQKANFPHIRLYQGDRIYSAEPLHTSKGLWQSCTPETAAMFSAAGYYFGKELYQKLNRPIGLINLSWGGTPIESWMSPGSLSAVAEYDRYLKHYWLTLEETFHKSKRQYDSKMQSWGNNKDKNPDIPAPQIPKELRLQNKPSYCFNGMINPIVGYSIAGVIWYQGEANTKSSSYPYYQEAFTGLITGWRDIWQQGDFPFLYVQLAASNGYGMGVAHIRQAQMQILGKVANTGMAVTMDIGDPADHHPKNKLDVGYRLSLWALKNKYGYDNIIPSGPLYKSKKIEGNKIRLFFDYSENGLVAQDGPLTNFEICGADKKFYPAIATIDSGAILVFSEKVPHPKHVSFAWCQYAEPNFYNADGLPASPFINPAIK